MYNAGIVEKAIPVTLPQKNNNTDDIIITEAWCQLVSVVLFQYIYNIIYSNYMITSYAGGSAATRWQDWKAEGLAHTPVALLPLAEHPL